MDGNLISENDDYRLETQASIPANVSMVSFEIGHIGGGWGFRTSYDNGFATTTEELNEYWKCTDNDMLINPGWNLEGTTQHFRLILCHPISHIPFNIQNIPIFS